MRGIGILNVKASPKVLNIPTYLYAIQYLAGFTAELKSNERYGITAGT